MTNLSRRSQCLVCDLTQVEFGFLMSGTFEFTDTKYINISLRSCFLKFSLRASFSTWNFDKKTCNIMRRFRPCLVVHWTSFSSRDLSTVNYSAVLRENAVWAFECCQISSNKTRIFRKLLNIFSWNFQNLRLYCM